MAKIKMQKDKASSGHRMATVLFSKADVSFMKEMIQKHPKGFYLSNVRILKQGEKV